MLRRCDEFEPSLARALHVYGDHSALLADTGIPPLTLIQYTNLAQISVEIWRGFSINQVAQSKSKQKQNKT